MINIRIVFILVIALLLTIFGFYNQYSIGNGWNTRMDKQMVSLAIGILAIIIIQFIKLDLIVKYSPLGFILGLLTLLVIPLGGGKEIYGAARWIDIGHFQFQPSEFSKIFLILILSYVLLLKLNNFIKFIFALLFFSIYGLLVYIQPDLGTSLVLVSIFILTVFFSKIPLKYLGVLFLIFILILPFAWFSLRDYQKARMLVFLNPGLDPGGIGYNLRQALIAIGSGEYYGKGFLKGTQARLGFLPVPLSDFALASLLEEGGFRLGILILSLYIIFLILMVSLINYPEEFSGKLIISGIIGMFIFEIVVNISMNIGLIPVVGLPLPFISYGGSAMIKNYTALGLLINACKKNTRVKYYV